MNNKKETECKKYILRERNYKRKKSDIKRDIK